MYGNRMDAAERLITSTQELLWERGYVGTSPKAIQQRAGAGQGSMYHHFTGKPDLARAAIDRLRAAGVVPLLVGGSGLYVRAVLDELDIPATDPEVLQTEIDTCWVNYSGEDPAAYVRKYAGRAPIVHLKDFVGSRGGAQPYALIKADGSDDGKNSDSTAFEFRPVGYGCQNVPAIVEAGLEAGAFCFVVEQDQWYDRPALEADLFRLRRAGLTKD